MYCFSQFLLLSVSLSGFAAARNINTGSLVRPLDGSFQQHPSPSMNANAPRATSSDVFNFDVRSDQIVLMMDGLADVSSRLAESKDPAFHKKDEDDGPPFKCHCKCTLLGGCECFCGDKDKPWQ